MLFLRKWNRLSIILLFSFTLTGSSYATATALKIGLIPEQNVFKQVKRYKPIGEYIEEKTGIKIEFTILSRYGNIIDNFVKEQMDGAFWGGFTGAMAIKKLEVEPIARPLWFNGTSTYHGYIFMRKDSGIRNVADMKGKNIAFVEKATMAGYIFPLAYFKEHGVNDIDKYFKEYFFAGSHDATIMAVLDGKAEIGCAKNTIFELFLRKDPRIKKELYIIAKSPEVPSNCLCVKRHISPEIKRQLRKTLLNMHNDPKGREVLREFGAMGFIETTVEDYKTVLNITKRAGLDIKNYEYFNY